MELQEAVLALEEPARKISDGINAIGAMTMGLTLAKDPYADGLNAMWNYLFDVNQELQAKIQSCLEFIP